MEIKKGGLEGEYAFTKDQETRRAVKKMDPGRIFLRGSRRRSGFRLMREEG